MEPGWVGMRANEWRGGGKWRADGSGWKQIWDFECVLVVVCSGMLGIMAGYGKGCKEKIEWFG